MNTELRHSQSGDTGPESASQPVIVGELAPEVPQTNIDRLATYDLRRGYVPTFRALPPVLIFSEGKWIRRSE
jgi:hypothetical protein